MKKILLALLVLCLCVCAAEARRNPGEKVGVDFDTLTYDFGTIKATDPAVHHDFNFTVTGSSAVAVLYASPSCGCTASEFPRKPVEAGATGTIKVSFNPLGQKGEVNKDVRVRLKNGDGKSEQLSLRIRGVVLPK